MPNTKTLTASYVLDAGGVKKGVEQANQHLGGLTAGLNKVGKVDVFGPLRGAANQMGGSFGPVTEGISMMQEGLRGVAERFKEIGNSAGANMRKAGTALATGGGVAAGLGATSMMIGAPIKQAHDQLAVAISDSGHDLSDYSKRIDEAKSHLVKFASGTEVENSIARLTTVMGDPKKALDSLNEVSDIAATKHISLAAATEMVAKAYANPTRLAKQFGITITASAALTKGAGAATKSHEAALAGLQRAQTNLGDLEARDAVKKKLTIADQQALVRAHEAVVVAQGKVASSTTLLASATSAATGKGSDFDRVMAQIGTKTAGQTSASTNNLRGTLNGLKNTVEESVGTFGNKFGPALTGVGAGVSLLGGGLGLVGKGMERFGTAGRAAAKAAKEVEAAQKTAAAAAEALTAAKAIDTTVTEGETVATTGLAVSEGLALAPILLIVAAVAAVIAVGYELVTHWTQVKQFLGEAFHAIARFATEAFDTWRKGITDVIRWFTDLPGRILGAVGDAGKWLRDAGKNIIMGFVHGIESQFDAVRRTLGHLTGSLTSWKGPPSTDAMLLHGSGKLILNGFVKGLESQYPRVKESLAGLSAQVGNTALAAPVLALAGTGAAGAAGGAASGAGGGVASRQPIVINQPIYLDGKKIGDFTYKYLLDKGVVNGGLFPGFLG